MELENHIFYLCTQVVYRRNRAIHKALRPIGVSATEFRVLSAVLRKGPLSMLDLAEWTAFERTRLTHCLHGMEARNWVARTNSDTDRRAVLVRITPEGEGIFQQAKLLVDEVTDVITSAASERDIERMRKTLRAMRSKLIAMGD